MSEEQLMRGIIQGDGMFLSKYTTQSNDDLMSASLLHKSDRRPETDAHSTVYGAASAYRQFATACN